MQSRLRCIFLLAAMAIFASASARADNLIQNGGFETGDLTGWSNPTGPFTFVARGNLETIGDHKGKYAAFFGSSGTLAGFGQTFSDVVGQQYTLSYYYASDGQTPNRFQALIDSVVVFNTVNDPSHAYQLYSFSFVGTGSDTVTFKGRDDNDYLGLDDVSVSTTVAATPEPSSLVLLGTGVLGAVGAIRRRMLSA